MPKKGTVRAQPPSAGNDREVCGGAFKDGRAKNEGREEVRKFQVVEGKEYLDDFRSRRHHPRRSHRRLRLRRQTQNRRSCAEKKPLSFQPE